MQSPTINAEPDNTAVRTALWRALHVQTDAQPHILDDVTGLALVAPAEGWQQRPDMHPEFTKRLRASVLARARFVEDLVTDESKKGISQYVILGAGLYLTRDAIHSMLKQITALATGSKLAMTFYLPIELLDAADRPLQEIADKGARAAGTPFVSFFTPVGITALAAEAGFSNAVTVSTADMERLYFADRSDGFTPATGEVFLVASI
jgi:O-methyltransferase involved in polyketide biosynthesis